MIVRGPEALAASLHAVSVSFTLRSPERSTPAESRLWMGSRRAPRGVPGDIDRIARQPTPTLADQTGLAHFTPRECEVLDVIAPGQSNREIAASLIVEVMVLGCGALGAPIAELCVRAGAARVDVIDNHIVTPGILVRQPYEDDEIGEHKAVALAARLNRVCSDAPVTAYVGSVETVVLSEGETPPEVDLIIDAAAIQSLGTDQLTATTRVSTRSRHQRRRRTARGPARRRLQPAAPLRHLQCVGRCDPGFLGPSESAFFHQSWPQTHEVGQMDR